MSKGSSSSLVLFVVVEEAVVFVMLVWKVGFLLFFVIGI